MQAIVPEFRSPFALLRDALISQKLNIAAPRVVTGNADTVIAVFLKKTGVGIRTIQNCGTGAVKVAINTDPTADNFHFLLAAGSSQDDGLGSIIDLSRYEGSVSVISSAAVRIATFEAMAPEARP